MSDKRFLIKKDAHSFLKENKVYPLFLDESLGKETDFSYLYNGDEDLKKYYRLDIKRVKELASFYDDTTLFLKNLKLNELYNSVEKTLVEITTKIKDNLSQNNSLIIVNISPLEGAIIGEIYKELGLKNIVFSFNRKMGVNYEEKTFEATLLLLLYSKSEFLKNKTKDLVQKIKIRNLDIDFSKIYMIIDENNSTSNYSHLKIDNYLKTAIGFNTPKNVYRLDKYPEVDFLNLKGIDNVLVFDNDDDLGKIVEYYKDEIKKNNPDIKFKQEKYTLDNLKNIGYFEQYLLEQNAKYGYYKRDIEKTALNKYKIEKNHTKGNYIANNKKTQKNNLFAKNTGLKEEDKKRFIVYILAIPVLFIAFLVNVNNTDFYRVGSYGHSISTSSWGNLGSYSSSSSTYSSSSRSSSVGSFGGGGFSKSSSS